jgi:alpha/beta superfamily hydrolase
MTATTIPALAFPETNGSLMLPGPAGALEIAVDLPPPGEARRGVAVLCHPNPPDGGTMHNKVVTMAARALAESGVAAVRFNFRGTGLSEGEFDNGRGEVLDLLAVARWAMATRPDDALWLGGFSFGAWVALQAARQLPVQQMISIAPPVGLRDFTGVMPPTCPWLLIQGEQDEIVNAAGVFDWAAKQEPAPVLVRMADTGHFFHRRLLDLRGAIKNGVRKNLPPLRGAS